MGEGMRKIAKVATKRIFLKKKKKSLNKNKHTNTQTHKHTYTHTHPPPLAEWQWYAARQSRWPRCVRPPAPRSAWPESCVQVPPSFALMLFLFCFIFLHWGKKKKKGMLGSEQGDISSTHPHTQILTHAHTNDSPDEGKWQKTWLFADQAECFREYAWPAINLFSVNKMNIFFLLRKKKKETKKKKKNRERSCRTWGSKPKSNMRSASSSTTYVTRNRFVTLLVNWWWNVNRNQNK